MRRSRPKSKALKRTVSLTIDSELYRQAKELRVNASRIAEEALANEVARLRAEALAADIRLDSSAADDYAEQHGSFADLAREHFASAADEAV